MVTGRTGHSWDAAVMLAAARAVNVTTNLTASMGLLLGPSTVAPAAQGIKTHLDLSIAAPRGCLPQGGSQRRPNSRSISLSLSST